MGKETSYDELKEEREHILKEILQGSIDEIWSNLKKVMIESDSLYTDRHVHTIWEGPSRGWLLPLPYESIKAFIELHPSESVKYFSKGLESSEVNIVGYSINVLAHISPETLKENMYLVDSRNEEIHTIFGSFGWSGTLKEYAIKESEEPGMF